MQKCRRTLHKLPRNLQKIPRINSRNLKLLVKCGNAAEHVNRVRELQTIERGQGVIAKRKHITQMKNGRKTQQKIHNMPTQSKEMVQKLEINDNT